MVVEVRPEDYISLMNNEELIMNNGERVESDSPLALMAFQERLEELCWLNGGMKQTAPAQRMVDFVNKKNSFDLPESSYTRLAGISAAFLDAGVRHRSLARASAISVKSPKAS